MFAVPALKNGPVVVASSYKTPKPVLVSAITSPVMFGPNISGINAVQYTPSCNGAFKKWGQNIGNVVAGDWAGGVPSYLDASASSAIYSKSSTVQPSAVRLLPCIKF